MNFSFDVMIEGKPVPRLDDMMVQNKGGAPNTPPMPEVQPQVVIVVVEGGDEGSDDDDDVPPQPIEVVSIEEVQP